jgi:hypothetical protein
MKKKYLLYGLLIIIMLISLCEINCLNDIKKFNSIDSIEQVQDFLQQATPKTLVIFDIDDTLIVPEEKIFYPLFKAVDDFDFSDTAFVKKLKEIYWQLAKSKEANVIFSKIKFIPVEQKTIVLIKELQNRNVKILALTNGSLCKFIGIEIMKKLRFSHMNQVGLDFSSSFNIQELILENLPPLWGYSPIFYKGILYALGSPKGTVLMEFLNKIVFKPDKVIFFDDLIEQCSSVSSTMEKLGIQCLCFPYRAEPKVKIKLDQKLVQKQFDYWTEHKKILPTEPNAN